MRYVLGLDVGGTKSHLAIFTKDAQMVAFETWGPLNHEVLPGSFRQLETELNELVTKTCVECEILTTDIEYGVFGVGGVDTKEQHRIVSGIIEKLGLGGFTLCNDAYLGVAAACSDNTGICAINGTGCTIAGIDRHGNMLQIGGIGDLSIDLGGASKIGMSVLGAVYEAMFRNGKSTALTKPLMDRLGIKEKHEYSDIIAQRISEDTTLLPSLNRLLFEHSDDDVAQEILMRIATNYSGGISCMLGELDFVSSDPVHVVFAGSVFAKENNPVLIGMVKSNLAKACPDYDFEYTTLSLPPVAGAVMWALASAKCEMDNAKVRETVAKSFDGKFGSKQANGQVTGQTTI